MPKRDAGSFEGILLLLPPRGKFRGRAGIGRISSTFWSDVSFGLGNRKDASTQTASKERPMRIEVERILQVEYRLD